MTRIREIKELHRKYAKMYVENRASVIELAINMYNSVTSYLYEEAEINPDAFGMTLLSAFIAERFMLLKYRSLYKHITVAIVGLGGSGKTTYSILSAYGALKLLGLSDEEAMDYVSMLTFFSAKEFVDFVDSLTKNRSWVPFIIVDDIGGQISKYWVFLGENYWAYLFSLLDQLKDWCGVLIMTARSFKSIPARLRELTDVVAEAREKDISGKVLDVFSYYDYDVYTSMKRKSRGIKFIDVLLPTAKIPQSLWNKMIDIRAVTAQERISYVKEMMELKPLLDKKRLEKLKKGVEAEQGD